MYILNVEQEDHYGLVETYRYCVYIQPHLYRFLKTKANERISFFLEYLVQKYEAILLDEKNFDSLKKATCTFQPKTKDYKRIVLNKIHSHLWKKLKVLKSITGYSISFLIRLFLEWEIEEQQIQNQNTRTTALQENNASQNTLTINNYVCCESWHSSSNEIYTVFIDFL